MARTTLPLKLIQKVIIILLIESLQDVQNVPLLGFLRCLAGVSLAIFNNLLVC